MVATITGTDGIGEDPVGSNSYNKNEVASLGGLVTRVLNLSFVASLA
jgi:hypothetical protein